MIFRLSNVAAEAADEVILGGLFGRGRMTPYRFWAVTQQLQGINFDPCIENIMPIQC